MRDADPARRAARAVRRPRRGIRQRRPAGASRSSPRRRSTTCAARRARSAPPSSSRPATSATTASAPPACSEIRGATAEAVVTAAEPVEREADDHRCTSSRATPLVEADLALPARAGARASLCVVDTRIRPAGRDHRLERPAGRSSPPAAAVCTASASSGETTVPLDSRYRYLRIRIANGDDPPLQDLRVTLRAYRDYVLLAPGFAPPYRVLYGGRRVRARIRLRRAAGSARAAAVRRPRAGARRTRRSRPPPDTRSFAERHPALITVALALAAAMLVAGGFLALRKRT